MRRPLAQFCTLLFLAVVAPCAVAQSPSDLWRGAGRWADSTLRTLTLEEKVAQLFAPATYGYFRSVDDPEYRRLVDLVENFGVGGMILFQGEPMDQALLLNDLQRRAKLPILVSQDMEWGAGMRIARTTTFPGTMAFGATRDPQLAYRAGYVTALEARALGTHQIYAPIADVNNNPFNPIINVRSYGERPGLVAEMVSAFIRGAQDGGVIATVKHFPGHGDTAVDSHADLPVLPFSRARLDTLELVPFRSAFEAGALSVMTGHLAFPQMEPDSTVGATLSRRITTDLLRTEMGFRGLVVSDAMNMEGVRMHYDVGEAAVRALEAGVDLLLMSEDPYAARNAILEAVASGRLSEARIDDATRRVLMAKEWAGLHQNRFVDPDRARLVVSTSAHRAFAEEVARRSLTLLRNEGNVLPLLGTAPRIYSVTLGDATDPATGSAFTSELRTFVPRDRLHTRFLGSNARALDYEEALAEAREAEVVVVPTFLIVRAWSGQIGLPEAHRDFLERLIAQQKPVVLISFGNPYLVMGVTQPAAYVAAYGSSEASQRAAVQAMFGAASFAGRLPITIPGLYGFGDGFMISQTGVRFGRPEEAGFDNRLRTRVDSLMRASIANRAFPGAAVAIGRGGIVGLLQGYGHFTYNSDRRVTPQSKFDVASLTKVIATTTAAMKLYEAGRLDLDAPLAQYFPAFGQNGKERVTVRQVMTHTSGLIPFRPFHTMGMRTREEVIDAIMRDSLVYEPGTDTRYSDLGIIALGLAIEGITGEGFGEWARREIFEPLGMHNTGYRAAGAGSDPTVVPTEDDRTFRRRLVQGEVHDETAFLLGGTAGHAGLFSTAEDLARFASMLANEGMVNGRPFLQPETVRLFTTRVDPNGSTRALGWDTRSTSGYSSAGTRFGPRSFGHTGFTGTSLWVDPDQKLFVILLTNRVYPTRENNKHTSVRSDIADIAYESLQEVPRPAPAR